MADFKKKRAGRVGVFAPLILKIHLYECHEIIHAIRQSHQVHKALSSFNRHIRYIFPGYRFRRVSFVVVFSVSCQHIVSSRIDATVETGFLNQPY
jgi:hypothetical protein